jgi:hypothetical protein
VCSLSSNCLSGIFGGGWKVKGDNNWVTLLKVHKTLYNYLKSTGQKTAKIYHETETDQPSTLLCREISSVENKTCIFFFTSSFWTCHILLVSCNSTVLWRKLASN